MHSATADSVRSHGIQRQAPQRLWLRTCDLRPLFNPAALVGDGSTADLAQDLSSPREELAPLADYYRLTRAHAFASREESLGLAPRPLVSGTTDFVMAQAALGKTLEDAMRNMAAAYNKLHVGEYNFVEVDDNACVFRVEDAAFPYTRPADASVTLMLECVLIYLHSALSTIVGQDLTEALRSVSTRRCEASHHDPLGFWACPVEYGARYYAIEYAPEVAGYAVAPGLLSEASVHNRILSLIERREAGLQLAFAPLVRQALRDGARDQHSIARRLGVSVATLRRRLVTEGQSFRVLRREHLNEAAKLNLLQAERVADVADALGFSDPRAFTRAFKGWNGLTPRSFRSRKSIG